MTQEAPESPQQRIDRLERRVARERAARRVAEELLEAKSLELYEANQALRASASRLEQEVAARTHELRNALLAAETATRAKSAFLAMMSHEIRTPMNAILGMAQLLEMSSLDEQQRGWLSNIGTAGDALLALIDSILDLSRIEAGRLELASEPLDVRALVTATLGLFQSEADAKGLTLTLDWTTAVPPLAMGDGRRLRQIFANLLSNAVKFTEYGSVTVSVGLSAAEDGGWWLNGEVRDSGIGIPGGKLDRLFHAFSQVDASSTRRHGGGGLGLAICARLCAAMGGEIDVASVPDEGSCFRFRVRLDAPPPPADGDTAADVAARGRRRPLPEDGRSLNGERVLVVDDNALNRALAVSLLKRLGAEPVIACDGVEALARFDETPFRIVLMDVQMPNMDGLEATRRLRQRPDGARAAIIAVTANAFESDRQQCLAAGMDEFLAKPVRFALLSEILFRQAARVASEPVPDGHD